MNKPSFWQRMTAYPARRGLGGAIAISIIGCGIVLLQVVPPDLRAQGAAWLGAFVTQLGALDPHILFSAAGGALVLGGVLLSLLPALRRTYRARPPRVAPTSVYLDYENQPLAVSKIPAFAAFLKQHIGNQRIECFFYTDETLMPHKGYVILRRYGFRMVQVAHKDKKLGGTNVKNMVDMEMTLHAFERATLTRERQHIVIIAADRDYLPLLYRLRALGHDVSVWARTLPHAILALQGEIGITCIEFGAQFGERAPEKPAAAVIASATEMTSVVLTIPPSSAAGSLAAVIEQTLHYWQEASQQPAKNQYDAFLVALASKVNLEQIGFDNSHRARQWATVLRTLGVLTQPKPGTMYGRGTVSVEQSTAIMVRFLDRLVATTQESAASAVDGIVELTVLSRQLRQLAKQSVDELSMLYKLTGESIHYTEYLLACARALGLIDYQAVKPQRIKVRAATTR